MATKKTSKTKARANARARRLLERAVLSDASVAIAVDGTLLLNIDELDGCDLEGRKLFVGVVLSGAEREDGRRMLRDACDDIRSRLGGQMTKRQPRLRVVAPEAEAREAVEAAKPA